MVVQHLVRGLRALAVRHSAARRRDAAGICTRYSKIRIGNTRYGARPVSFVLRTRSVCRSRDKNDGEKKTNVKSKTETQKKNPKNEPSPAKRGCKRDDLTRRTLETTMRVGAVSWTTGFDGYPLESASRLPRRPRPRRSVVSRGREKLVTGGEWPEAAIGRWAWPQWRGEATAAEAAAAAAAARSPLQTVVRRRRRPAAAAEAADTY